MQNAIVDLSPEEQRIFTIFNDAPTYEAAARKAGVSKAQVWRVARKCGALRHQDLRDARRRTFLEAVVNTTKRMDALAFLKSLPNDSVQLILSSPPYNVGKEYSEDPFADTKLHLEFVGYMIAIIAHCKRVLKPNGVLVLQVGTTFNDDGDREPLAMLLYPYLRQAGLTFINDLILVKKHGLTPKRALAGRHEYALIFCKGDNPTFNANAVRLPQKHFKKRHYKGPNKGKPSGSILGAAPQDVWVDDQIKHNHPEKTGHPAQFSLSFATKCVLLFTNPTPDDLVVDMFHGSGTTQSACIKTGRPTFAGSDIGYGPLRDSRIAATTPDLVHNFTGVTAESLAFWASELKGMFGGDALKDVAIAAAPDVAERDPELCMEFMRELPRRRRSSAA